MSSVTCKKNKKFQTPVGDFTYRYLNMKKYPGGGVQKELEPDLFLLLASPEKALVDYLTLVVKPKGRWSVKELFLQC